MNTQAIRIDFVTAGRVYGPELDIRADDDLHYRFEGVEGTLSTATLTLRFGVTEADETGPTSALTLDGGVYTLDVSKYATVRPVVGVAQSGFVGILHMFTRPVNTIDGGGA